MDYYTQLLVEAIIVGVSVIAMGTFITYIFAVLSSRNTDFIWNINMFFALFFIGFCLHLFYEFAGLNKYYCRMFNKTRK